MRQFYLNKRMGVFGVKLTKPLPKKVTYLLKTN